VTGVAALLAQIREENVAGLVDQGKADDEAGALTEDDSKFTLAEETRREMRREEKKKRKEEDFKNAVTNCELNFVKTRSFFFADLLILPKTNPQKIQMLKVTLIKRCLLLVWLVPFPFFHSQIQVLQSAILTKFVIYVILDMLTLLGIFLGGLCLALDSISTLHSQRRRQRQTYDENSKCSERLRR
jgi:U1 small nuclear ribonucleoprotein of 70kDa MW N terminal